MLCEHKYNEIINQINKNIKENQDILWALENLKRAHKKDGKPFARLSDNYPDAKISLEYHWNTSFIWFVKLYGCYGKKTPYGGASYLEQSFYIQENQQKKEITFDDMEALIAERIEVLKARCESYEQQLKAAKKAFEKIDHLVWKINVAIDSIDEAKDGHYKTTLGYGLQEYAKYAIR